jgi:hypothetical protein
MMTFQRGVTAADFHQKSTIQRRMIVERSIVRKKQANEASRQFCFQSFFCHPNPIFFPYTHFFILQDLSPTTPGRKALPGNDIPRKLANATPSQPIPSQQPQAPV